MSRRAILLATVFLTGALVLVIEVVAVRVLSPYFGNTIFSFSSIITVILAALSVGYAYGGRYADAHPDVIRFYRIILYAGASASLMTLLALRALPEVGDTLSIIYGPLLVSVVLFFLPAFFLGMLSPFVVRLLMDDVTDFKQAGKVSGLVFFWSTLGSICGSLATGFVFIPRFGTSSILMGSAMTLVLLGLFGLWYFRNSAHSTPLPLVILPLLFLGIALFSEPPSTPGLIYTKDGLYEKITITNHAFPLGTARFLMQDRSFSAAVFLGSPIHVFDYTKYFELYKLSLPTLNRALAIGAGAFTIPKAILATSPTVTVDAVDIEPDLYNLARAYFELEENPRLQSVTEDGRRFLSEAEEPYDLIFSDVYYSHYSIPDHMVTREFFSLAKLRLSDGGVFMANVIGNLEEQEGRTFTLSAMKTFRSAFPNSLFFAIPTPGAEAINMIFLGFQNDEVVSPQKLFVPHPELANFLPHLIDANAFDYEDQIVFTDDYVPAAYLTAKLF